MSEQDTEDIPEPLLTTDATELERRLLDAGGRERPSPELVKRMALGIGVSVPVPGPAAPHAAPQPLTSSSSLWPWLGGGAVLAVAAGVWLTRQPAAAPPAPVAPVSVAPSALERVAAPTPTPAAASDSSEPSDVASPSAPAAPSSRRPGSDASSNDLARQIARVDAARQALAQGQAARALQLVTAYRAEFPRGAFRPEVAAVEVEALVKLGRVTEARALAGRFQSAYGSGPLADRVERLVGSKP